MVDELLLKHNGPLTLCLHSLCLHLLWLRAVAWLARLCQHPRGPGAELTTTLCGQLHWYHVWLRVTLVTPGWRRRAWAAVAAEKCFIAELLGRQLCVCKPCGLLQKKVTHTQAAFSAWHE